MKRFSLAHLCSMLLGLSTLGSFGAVDTGTLDTAFVPKLFNGAEAQATATTADGKLYVGGSFEWINGVPADWIARLNADGTVDASFNPVNYGDSDRVLVIAPQTDGKVLVGYFFSLKVYAMADTINTVAVPAQGAARSTTNTLVNSGGLTLGSTTTIGSLTNTSTGNPGTLTVGNPGTPLVINPGPPLVYSPFSGRIIRLNADGSRDESFNMVTLGADWASDNLFDVITTIQQVADGKILVGGSFQSVNDKPIRHLARLNSDGTVDETFTTTVYGTVDTVLKTPDGGVLLGGNFTKINKQRLMFGIAKLNAKGKQDTKFLPRGNLRALRVSKLAAGPSNSIVAATVSNNVKGGVHVAQPTATMLLLDASGRLTRTVTTALGKPVGLALANPSTAMLVCATDAAVTKTPAGQAPATVTYAAIAKPAATAASNKMATLLSGVVNLTFRPNSIFPTASGWQGSGSSGTAANATANLAGSQVLTKSGGPAGSPAFWVANSASAYKVLAASDGGLFVLGNFTLAMAKDGTFVQRPGFAKLDAKGNADKTFAPVAGASIQQWLASADGGVTILGVPLKADGNYVSFTSTLYQLKADGSVDSGFTQSDGATVPLLRFAAAMVHDSKGRIVIGSTRDNGGSGPFSPALMRFSKAGAADNAFAPDFTGLGETLFAPYADTSVSVLNITPEPEGSLLVGGHFSAINGVARTNVARLLEDGSVDTTVLTAGAPNGFTNVLPRANGGYLITAKQQSLFYPIYYDTGTNLLPAPVSVSPDQAVITDPVLPAPVGASPSQAVIIGPIYSKPVNKAVSPFLGTTASGAADANFSESVAPTSTWTWFGGYGVRFIAPLRDGGWVAMTRGLTDKATGKALSLVIMNQDGTLRSGYAAPEFGSPPNQYGGGYPLMSMAIWWWPREPADFVQDFIALDDGSLVVAGNFWSVNGEARCGVAKLLPVPMQLQITLNDPIIISGPPNNTLIMGPPISGPGLITVTPVTPFNPPNTLTGNIVFNNADSNIVFTNLDWSKITSSVLTISYYPSNASQQAFADAAVAHLGDKVTLKVLPAATSP